MNDHWSIHFTYIIQKNKSLEKSITVWFFGSCQKEFRIAIYWMRVRASELSSFERGWQCVQLQLCFIRCLYCFWFSVGAAFSGPTEMSLSPLQPPCAIFRRGRVLLHWARPLWPQVSHIYCLYHAVTLLSPFSFFPNCASHRRTHLFRSEVHFQR